MSTTRWRLLFCGSLLLAPLAMFGFRPADAGRGLLPSRILWQGEDTAWAVAFSPDGKAIAFGTGVLNGSDGASVLDLATGDQLASFSGYRTHIIVLAFSEEGRSLTTVSYDGAKRWDLTRSQESNAWPVSRVVSTPSITLTADGRFLAFATSSVGESLHVVELGNEPITVFGVETQEHSKRLALAAEGRTLAAAYPHGKVRLWDLDRKQERSSLRGPNQSVAALAFSPDGQTLAGGCHDGTVWFWDLKAGTARGGAQGHTGLVGCLAFSPGGQTLASGSEDNTIRLWGVADSAERGILCGHTDRVNAVAFAPDGRALASASSDQTVRLWELGAAR